MVTEGKASLRARWRGFDEIDYQMVCQVYLWALPLVWYAEWKSQPYEVFGATTSDPVHYVSYRDRLGLVTVNAVLSQLPDREGRCRFNYTRVGS